MKQRIRLTESQLHSIIRKCVNEAVVNGGLYHDKELNFTHFAVNKQTGLIVDGWDYEGYESEDLKGDMRSYFYDDLADNDFNPREYKILTFKGCLKQGINPNDNSNWSNDGINPLK